MRAVIKKRTFALLFVSVVLAGILGLGSESQRPAPPMAAFESSFLGIAGIAPEGWIETYPGTFHRGAEDEDPTLLVLRSYPQIDSLWLMTSTLFAPGSRLGELPQPAGTLRAHLEWALREIAIEVVGVEMILDLALADAGESSYVALLLSNPAEREQLREDIFLPAVEKLAPVGIAQEETTREDNAWRFAYDESLPLDIQLVRRSATEGMNEIELTYVSPAGGRVPAILLVPDGEGPFPAIVFQHGFPGHRYTIRNLARRHAALGAICIMIDAPWARPELAGRSYPLTLDETDRDEQVQLIVDLQRAVDFLLSRSDVDPEQLAYVGVSYGGAMGGLLAGIERRLKAYVLIVGDGGLVTHFFGLPDLVLGFSGWESALAQQRWVEAMWSVEPLHYVGHASPAALLFQNGRTDIAVTPPDAIRYQVAGSSPKTVQWYDAGHNLTDRTFFDHVEWLEQFIVYRARANVED